MDLKEKEKVTVENSPVTKPKKSKKRKILIFSGIGVIAVAAIIVVSVIQSAAAGAKVPPQITVPLQKTNLTSSISVSGVVKSENTTNIYSNQSYPIQEIYVEVGDSVKAGDVLAQLDMSKLEKDLTQAELNLESAESSAKEEERSKSNSITNAQTSLESSQIALSRQQLSTANAEKDLKKAEAELAEPFDSYIHDQTINDAKTTADRKAEDLRKAEEDLDEALYFFDDYTYQNNIREAKITLERKQADLADAESDLNANSFDGYSYEVAIDNAQRAYENARDDYDDNDTTANERALESAKAKLSEAKDNYYRAQNDYLESAQTTVDNAQKSVDDAQRAYDKAISDLDRAKRDAATNAYDALTKAQNAMDDAQRAYEKALKDKERAIEDYIEDNKTSLENAQKAYDESQKQLQSAQNSLKSAKNSLNQTKGKLDSSGISVELQELNLDKLATQLAEGKIVATVDGVITEMNAKVGAAPSGILFVIEDVDDLYVSAKIKEYNLSSVSLNQDATVTTDATGDTVYNGAVSYISPKAVSEAGSTSVEFEIRASIKAPDTAVKIGMNAFLDIITDSKENVFAVPQSMLITNERGTFVVTLEDDVRKEIPVTVGMKTSTSAEISGDGLHEGMMLLADPEGNMTVQFQGSSAMGGGPMMVRG